MKSFTLEKLAGLLGGTPLGSIDVTLTNLQDSKKCNKQSVCYLKDLKFCESLSSDAGAVITTEEIAKKLKKNKNFIIVDDPYLAYAQASNIFLRASLSCSNFLINFSILSEFPETFCFFK